MCQMKTQRFKAAGSTIAGNGNGRGAGHVAGRRTNGRASAAPPKHAFTFHRRASGLLLHPTSLPGPHGSGALGAEARAFIDFLSAAGRTWGHTVPGGPPGAPPGNSPYSSFSSFAGN